MEKVVEQVAPWLKRVIPAALISDCFVSLYMYSDYTRYFANIRNLIVISIIFLLFGLINTRR